MPTAKKQPAKRAPAARRPAPRANTPATVEASVVITDIPSMAEVKEAITSRSKFYFDGDVDGSSVLVSSFDRFEQSGNIEDLFNTGELLKVKDHYGTRYVLQGIDAVRNSEFEEQGGLGIYLIVSAVDKSTGELVKLGVGASQPLGLICALHWSNNFPWEVSFEQAEKKTKAGFLPVNMISHQPRDQKALKAGEKPF